MSLGPNIAEEVRRFIRDRIDSAAKLETLLFLAERRNADWSADEVSRELRTAPELAMRTLAELREAGLLEMTEGGSSSAGIAGSDTILPLLQKNASREPRYCFSPRDSVQATTVESLAKLYRERRYTVLDLIYAEPEEDTEPEPPAPEPEDRVRAFSDAFRLWRERN